MTLQRFSLVSFPADDVLAAVDFYRRALGWEPAQVLDEGMAFYQFNGFVFSIAARSGWSEEELGIDPPAYSVAAINFPSTAEVDAAVAAWVAAGGAVQKMPHATYWGGYSGYVRDAAGNLLEFAMNPEWPITDEGYTVMPTP
jgi:catechol 2,3-dioxygenase-like lactoylglutathione lyase family enzyme